MGKIIYYDFRAKEREREKEEITMRIIQRLQKISNYYDPEQQEQSRIDYLRYAEIEQEEEQVQRMLKLNEEGELE